MTQSELVDVNHIDKHVGARIRRIREERHLRTADLAERLGLCEADLNRLETGMDRCRPQQMIALAKALDVPVQSFFEDL